MLFKQNPYKHRDDLDILMRLDRLTRESNTLLKILVGLRPPVKKEESSTHRFDIVENDTDMSEDDMSEDEGSLMVCLSKCVAAGLLL